MNYGPLEFAAYLKRKDTSRGESAAVRAAREAAPKASPVERENNRLTIISGGPMLTRVARDAQVEAVHFDRRWLSLEDIGFRSFQAAVSDLAAMGARPVAALSSLALPPALKDRELEAIVRGQAEAARDCDCPIVGGNLSKASEMAAISTPS